MGYFHTATRVSFQDLYKYVVQSSSLNYMDMHFSMYMYVSLKTCTMILYSMPQAQQLVRGSDVNHDPSAHENEPSDLPVGINIQNLTKVYDEVSH